MLKSKTIATLVSAYNEGPLITKTLSTMPDFVDKIIVINDCGTDDTLDRIKEYQKEDDRVVLVEHEVNKGLGTTIKTGFTKAKELEMDVTAIMNGDAQMDPEDLPTVVMPVVDGEVDFCKGNRLTTDSVVNMPKLRFFGNGVLSFMSKMSSGYFHTLDSQCAYSAISLKAINTIPYEEMTSRYGYNTDLMNLLNIADFKLKDVPVKAVYGDEESKIKLGRYIVKTLYLQVKWFNRRMWRKYIVRSFNPLVLFYKFGGLSLFVSLAMLIRFLYRIIWLSDLPKTTALVCFLAFFTGCQFIFFGMWMDMEDNKRLDPNRYN